MEFFGYEEEEGQIERVMSTVSVYSYVNSTSNICI